MAVKPIPEGYHSVTPYLVLHDAARGLEFYKQAFGATELFRMPMPGGKIGHAEIKIGDSVIMLADEFPDMGFRSPQAIGGTPVSLMIYVPDVDRVAAQTLAAGAKELRPVQNQFYGDRSGTFVDPFGHVWTVATHVEDVPPDEMARRGEKAMAEMAGKAQG
jgi:PhnB protein